MRRMLAAFALILIAAITVSCGGGNGWQADDDPNGDVDPAPAPEPEPGPAFSVYPQQAGDVLAQAGAGEGEQLLAAVARSGYNFVGWFFSDGKLLSFSPEVSLTEAMGDLVACFVAAEPLAGDDLLAAVSKLTTLGEYDPADLVYLPSHLTNRERRLRKEAADMLSAMAAAAAEDGVRLLVVSAYRPYASQERIFNNYAAKHGVERANRFSARPGQSEHQLGTTVDFGGTKVDFEAEFANTDSGRWLKENAHRFGFALSYPRDAEHITGYIYEPWHYRYIGVEAAARWHDSGLTLFEYIWYRRLEDAGLASRP